MKTRILFTTFLLCVIASASMADEQKALLDSTIWNEGGFSLGKSEYTYNTSGQMVLSYDYHWEKSSKSWNVTMKYEYFYNEKGDRIERTDYMWNADGGKWMGYQQIKTSYTYDADDRITSSIDSFLYLNIYTQVYKYTYKYDASGKLIARETFLWNEDLEVFGEAGKRIYTYDSDGNLIEILTYDWDDKAESFKKSGRYEMIYDENGYLISEVVSMWKDDGEWQLINKNTYYYHGYNTALNQFEVSHEPKSTKLLRDGKMYILREGKTYSVTGQEVK